MKKALKIVGKKAEPRRIGSGAFRRDILGIITSDVGVDESDIPSWLDSVIDMMEERYTPRHPSLRDQVHFMTSLGALVSQKPPEDAPTTINEAMFYLGNTLGLSFDEEPALRFYPDSPQVGDPACICSYCEEVVEELPIVRLSGMLGLEARLHMKCYKTCQNLALIPLNIENAPIMRIEGLV